MAKLHHQMLPYHSLIQLIYNLFFHQYVIHFFHADTYTDVTFALDEDTSAKVSGNVQKSFGWAKVKARMEADKETSLNYQTQTVMTIMRDEHSYASVLGNRSPLSADAKILLEEKDYVGFYNSCGE